METFFRHLKKSLKSSFSVKIKPYTGKLWLSSALANSTYAQCLASAQDLFWQLHCPAVSLSLGFTPAVAYVRGTERIITEANAKACLRFLLLLELTSTVLNKEATLKATIPSGCV